MSRLIKGGWQLSEGHGDVDYARAIDDMAAFAEAGITTFACADHYLGVEDLIGRFRREHPGLAAGNQVYTCLVPDLDRLATLDASYIGELVDRSRQRLGMDRLDLLQIAWWDYGIPGFLEMAQMVQELQQQGRIAHIGATNYDVPHMQAMLDAGIPLVSNQLQYSLLDRRPEASGMVRLCQDHDVNLLCYGALAGGFLSETWLDAAEPGEPFANRSLRKYKLIIDDFGGWALFQQLLRTLRNIGARHDATLGQVAVRWVLDRPGVATVMVGATSTRHLAENLSVFTLALTEQDTAQIDAILSRSSGPEGECFALERDSDGRHGRIMRYNQNAGRH